MATSSPSVLEGKDLIKKRLSDCAEALPQWLYERNSGKATFLLLKCIVLLSAAYATLILLPWFLLPIGWLFAGTAFAGLLAVGYACSNDSFFNNTFVNHLVGQLCLLPLMMPFESWRVQYRETKDSFRQKILNSLSTSHFWWCSSSWEFLTSNFTIPVMEFSHKRILANLALLYVAVALFFPLMTYNLGIWGLFKYYLIPFAVYHFWASSCLKTSSLIELLNDSDFAFVQYKYPKWFEFISLELNFIASSSSQIPRKADRPNDAIPSYHLREAWNIVSKNASEGEKFFRELSFVSVIRSRFGDLIEMKEKYGNTPSLFSNINRPTTLFMFLTPVISLYGMITCDFYLNTYIVSIAWFYFSGLGVTTGYHRLWSHRSYDAHPAVKLVLLTMATAGFEMSCIDWCRDHRAHHRFTDTPKDPYNINQGLWHAHIGWLLYNRNWEPDSDVSDLLKDPMLRFQDKYFLRLAVLVGIVLPTLVCGFGWGDWWGGLFIGGIFSKVLVLQATFCINSLAHYWGDATFTDQRTPRDSYLVSLITWGEGFHNFHHEFPFDYRNGVHMIDYDPGKWIICGLSYFGLTYNLRRFSEELIQKGKIQMKEKKLITEKSQLNWGIPYDQLPIMTMEEVSQKVKEEGKKWVVVENQVLEVGEFTATHPGGSGFIKAWVGKDASYVFNGGVYKHSNAARNLIANLSVARIVGNKKED